MTTKENRTCFKCFEKIKTTETWYYRHVDKCNGPPARKRKRHLPVEQPEDSLLLAMEEDVQIVPDIQENRPKVSINNLIFPFTVLMTYIYAGII